MYYYFFLSGLLEEVALVVSFVRRESCGNPELWDMVTLRKEWG